MCACGHTNDLGAARAPLKQYIYYHVAGYKITYFVATLSYDNYYVNLRDYSNSLLNGLL